MIEKRIVIFGAGFYGKLAFEQLDKEMVAFFIDNSREKQGGSICGKDIKSPNELLNSRGKYHVLIASLYQDDMRKQLDGMGIIDYSLCLGERHDHYKSGQLVINPYKYKSEAITEKEWSNSEMIEYSRKAVYNEVERLYNNQPLFDHIELETVNRCNGNCSFCPINSKIDPREKAVMSEGLFKKIVGELEEINYSGRLSTFSNNEPLLDDRIVEFNQYARRHLPNARFHLYTNGTLMTLDKFVKLVDVLDELTIDNYQQDLKLIKPCLEIKEYCNEHPELISKVSIVLRKPDEILTSRGGNAPNRKELKEYPKDRCILPFKQLIIRPTGKVSLCCNDALGKFTLGNAEKEKLLDIWYGQKFQTVRKCLYDGRENWGDCKYCDTFSMGW